MTEEQAEIVEIETTLKKKKMPTQSNVSEVTIKVAQDNYKKLGSCSVNSSYRTLIEELVEQDSEALFSNDSYEDALFLSDMMLQRTRHSFFMVCGISTGAFLETLKDPVVECLERLKKNGGVMKMIALGAEPPSILQALRKQFPETFHFKMASSIGEDPPHFMTSDDKMVRIEEKHPPLTENTPASTIKAKVSFDDPNLAKIYRNVFERGWKHL